MSLRQDALASIHAAIAAVEPERLVRSWLEGRLAAFDQALGRARSIHLAAFGKAAGAMARGAVAALGNRLLGGVVLVPAEDGHSHPVLHDSGLPDPSPPDLGLPERFRIVRGGHPVPSAEGVAGARAIRDLARSLGEGDLLLVLVSGGGSALLTLPPDDIPLEAVRATTAALLEAGADIRQLNTVRKHLDEIKGGRLALAAHPARTLALVLSDVVGDPLDVIASGPVTPDPTISADALRVLDDLGLTARVPEAVRRHLVRGCAGEIDDSLGPGDPAFASVTTHVVGDNRLAVEAARDEAERLGYRTLLLSTRITGEAREVGRVLAGIAAEIVTSGMPVGAPACVVAGGETTVTVTGPGRGGRNQELALGAAVALDELLGSPGYAAGGGADRIVVAAVGTDGVDGPTDAAGAIATESTLQRARERGLDARRALAENDAHPFFAALGDLIALGPTGTNVMDLLLVLVRR